MNKKIPLVTWLTQIQYQLKFEYIGSAEIVAAKLLQISVSDLRMHMKNKNSYVETTECFINGELSLDFNLYTEESIKTFAYALLNGGFKIDFIDNANSMLELCDGYVLEDGLAVTTINQVQDLLNKGDICLYDINDNKNWKVKIVAL